MQEFHNTTWRVPYDLFGGRLLPCYYNPNIQVDLLHTYVLGKTEYEIQDYNDLRKAEAYVGLLEQQQLLRWREFFTGRVGGKPAIIGGDEQWLEIEIAHETSSPNVQWGTNWNHSVNFHFGKTLPRFLVEIWVGESFAGEYLLPELDLLATMNQTRTLWPLVEDSGNFKDGISRKDYRKQTVSSHACVWPVLTNKCVVTYVYRQRTVSIPHLIGSDTSERLDMDGVKMAVGSS